MATIIPFLSFPASSLPSLPAFYSCKTRLCGYTLGRQRHPEQRPDQMMPNRPPKVSARRFLRIDRRQIAYFKFTLEAYEGVALMRTIDPRLGTVELLIGPGCEWVVAGIIEDLGTRIKIEEIGDAE